DRGGSRQGPRSDGRPRVGGGGALARARGGEAARAPRAPAGGLVDGGGPSRMVGALAPPRSDRPRASGTRLAAGGDPRRRAPRGSRRGGERRAGGAGARRDPPRPPGRRG